MFMINCCVLFSLLITVNIKSLFAYCLFIRMVSLFISVIYIMAFSMANLCFILALNADNVKNIVRTNVRLI